MWARARQGKRRERWRCLPVVLAAGASIWLLTVLALFVELGADPESSTLSPFDRWGKATYKTAGLVRQPATLLESMLSSRDTSSRRALAAELGVPRIRIMVAPQHRARLQEEADAAIARGILIQSDDSLVPAWIDVGGEPMRAKVRLKGDWIDHLYRGRWSLRVQMRGGARLFGMRHLSLQAPSTRGGHGELILLDQMRAAGVLAPRSFPVVVEFGGRDFGVMLVEEHFDKPMIEATGRRPGVILAFDESAVWQHKVRFEGQRDNDSDVLREPRIRLSEPGTMPIRVFRKGDVQRDPVLREQAAVAVGLLRGYVQGLLAPDDVFDMKLWARHHCLVSLWGSPHGLADHNLRFYFNPITRLLEPVAFDNHTMVANLHTPVEWHTVAFVRGSASARFQAECAEFLEQYARKLDVGALLEREREVRSTLRTLGDMPLKYPVAQLLARGRELASMSLVSPAAVSFDVPDRGDPWGVPPPSALLICYWVEDGRGSQLELASTTRADVVVDAVRWTNGERVEDLPVARGVKIVGDRARRTKHTLAVPWTPRDDGELQVFARRARGSGPVDPSVRHDANRGGAAMRSPLLDSPTLEALAESPYLAITSSDRLVVRSGEWEIRDSLVVPAGVNVQIEAGARLRFASAARFVVRGALTSVGTAEMPVELGPIATADGWGGLVVLGDDDAVVLSHTVVRATAPVADPSWCLTGGVTLHRCDVRIESCRFEGTSCEDALNLVGCQFELLDSTFLRTRSDAFDGDVVDGSVRDCEFFDVGGDAVDVSHSRIELERMHAERVVDKAVSVGEQSTCSARALDLRDVGTGLVAKDGSSARVDDARVENARVASFMAYIKKPEFGAAHVDITNASSSGDAPAAILQRGSTMILDGHAVSATRLDVEELYRTAMRKHR